MMRQSSSRNQRTKGFKVKNVLQVCLLIAVCIWLLYQVKHSHDKKKALEERNLKLSNNLVESRTLGRKDLPEIVADTDIEKETVTHVEEESEEAEEVEPETKQEDIGEIEGRGAGDDEIDENDQERADEEAEQGGEFGDEDEKEPQLDDLGSLENQEHDEADAGNQEAREQHYKGDDASSAVVRDTQAIESETGNLSTGNKEDEQVQDTWRNNLEIEDTINKTEDGSKANELGVVGGKGETQSNNNSSSVGTVVGETEPEVASSSNSTTVESNDQMQQETNSTSEAVPNDQKETHESSAVIDVGANGSIPEKATVSMDAATGQNATVELGNSASENVLEQSHQFNTTVGAEKSEGSSGTSLSSTKDGGAAQGESTNSSASVTEEDKEARGDLLNLSNTQSETKNTEGIAAE